MIGEVKGSVGLPLGGTTERAQESPRNCVEQAHGPFLILTLGSAVLFCLLLF